MISVGEAMGPMAIPQLIIRLCEPFSLFSKIPVLLFQFRLNCENSAPDNIGRFILFFEKAVALLFFIICQAVFNLPVFIFFQGSVWNLCLNNI